MGIVIRILKKWPEEIALNRFKVFKKGFHGYKKCMNILILLLALCSLGASASDWVGTWAASPQPSKSPLNLTNQTLHQFVRISQGGKTLRLRLSNLFGEEDLHISSVKVDGHLVSFNNRQDLLIPKGVEIFSDSLTYSVPDLANLKVSLTFADSVTLKTFHAVALQNNVIIQDETGEKTTTESWYILSGVEILSQDSRSIVTFGDSITDGVGSSTGQNNRWPDVMAQLLQSTKYSVLNEGIGFNRILEEQTNSDQPSRSGLDRFERDVLGQNGVKAVIIFEGINDIGLSATYLDPQVIFSKLIVSYQKLMLNAEQKGLKVILATLSPMSGSGYGQAAHEKARSLVNHWIRSSSNANQILDFDLVLRDPSHPERLLPKYDSGDHLHPNDSGYEAMGKAASDLFK